MIEVPLTNAQWGELQSAEAQVTLLNERKSLIARFVLLGVTDAATIDAALKEGRVHYGTQSLVIDDAPMP